MDFKYIEQLLERYFAAETTLQEEQILREFFAQDEVPVQLQPWKALFAAEKSLAEAHLDDHFDQRMLQLTGEQHVQARRITLGRRLYPLFKAAAPWNTPPTTERPLPQSCRPPSTEKTSWMPPRPRS